MPNDHELLKETYQLAKENNKMLHAMRRNAFLGGILKLIIYAAIALVPIWLYMQYLAPQVDRMLGMMTQIQGTSVQAQTQIGDWQKAFNDFRAKIPGMSSSTAH